MRLLKAGWCKDRQSKYKLAAFDWIGLALDGKSLRRIRFEEAAYGEIKGMG